MDGFKLIKITFEGAKSIVGVTFDGVNDYNLLLDAVRKTFCIDEKADIAVYSQDFVIKPEIFSAYIVQFLASPEFILNIKLLNQLLGPDTTPPCSYQSIELVSHNQRSSGSSSPATLHAESSVGSADVSQFINFTGTPIILQTNNYLQILPTNEDIKNIEDIQVSLRVLNQSGTLENRDRVKIAKAIILFVLKDNKTRILTKDHYLQLANSIVDIFRGEVKETYYVPFTKGHLARGKLFDAYNNHRARLSAVGLISRRIKTKLATKISEPVLDASIEDKVRIADDIEIIVAGTADWDHIKAAWANTHSRRQKELDDKNLTTNQYFEKYSILSNDKSNELFEIDCRILYPQLNSIYEWQEFYIKIINKAKKLRDRCAKEILARIDATDEEDSKLALAFMLVPYLLPNPRKLSKIEIQETFIQYCQNIIVADDEARLELKRQKLEKQPKVYIIGDSNNTVCFAYVDICNQRLKYQNPIKANEVCFHFFMGMNIEYPRQCAQVWQFLQQLVFNINTPWDSVIPVINTLMNDLNTEL